MSGKSTPKSTMTGSGRGQNPADAGQDDADTSSRLAHCRVGLPHIDSAERASRRLTILHALNAGADPETIRRACAQKHGMSGELTDEWIRRLKNERAEQFEAERPKFKAEQVARLQSDLAKMRMGEKKPWASIHRHEQLLARIVGTIEPVGVVVSGTVTVREALVAVIQHMDMDAIDEVVREELELVEQAKVARQLTGAVIDADGDLLPS